jgi:hypothetical protein
LERRHKAELEAELRGDTKAPIVPMPKKRTREEVEKSEKAMASIVMSKRNRKLMGVIKYSKAKKDKYVNRLRDKRRKIDEQTEEAINNDE